MPDSWSEGDIHTLYSVAHADIWSAKRQQWSATGWAFALMFGLYGLKEHLCPSPSMRFADIARCLQLLIAALTSTYVASLHGDVTYARRTIRRLRKQRPQLTPTANHRISHTGRRRFFNHDALRGAIYPLTQVVAISAAFWLASVSVVPDGTWSAVAAALPLCIGVCILTCISGRLARRESANR